MEYLIMCIGNREGGDDSVGSYVADKLKNRCNVLDCGTTPENYTSVVNKQNPDKLIIIDAAEMGLKPGEIRIVPKEKIGVMTISTHGIPISVLIGYLEQHIKKIIFIGIQPKKIIFIGIQPKTMSGNITDPVKEGADRLIEIIKNKKIDRIETLK